MYYRWTDTHTFEKEPDPFNPFPFDIRVKLGTIGVRTVVDSFDNLFDPRRGYGLTSDLGWSADAFGSDFNYVSWLTNFTLALDAVFRARRGCRPPGRRRRTPQG